MIKILQVCVCPCSGQADLFSLFGVATMNLFLGPDFAHHKLDRGGEGYRLSVSCLTLAAVLFTHPACYLTELKSC